MTILSGNIVAATWNTTAGAKTLTLPSTLFGTNAIAHFPIVVCANSGRTTAQAPTVTDNFAGGTYTQVASCTKNASADSMWVFVRDNIVWMDFLVTTSVVITMTPVATDTGGGLACLSLSGAYRTGAGAVRQVGTQNNVASGTPTVAMPSGAMLATNFVFGAVMTGSNVTTNVAQPALWNEDTDLGYNTPATGLEVAYRASEGDTSSTVTWGGAAASAFCSVAVELWGLPAALPDVGVATVLAA